VPPIRLLSSTYPAHLLQLVLFFQRSLADLAQDVFNRFLQGFFGCHISWSFLPPIVAVDFMWPFHPKLPVENSTAGSEG
jgi:hypothetical protein